MKRTNENVKEKTEIDNVEIDKSINNNIQAQIEDLTEIPDLPEYLVEIGLKVKEVTDPTEIPPQTSSEPTSTSSTTKDPIDIPPQTSSESTSTFPTTTDPIEILPQTELLPVYSSDFGDDKVSIFLLLLSSTIFDKK